MTNSQTLLKKHFGYDSFRSGQEEIINNILQKKDCLGIMPTGAGKSICYQIPAMILPGMTIVISPLISLMKDQVDSLNQMGIPATFINSTLTSVQYAKTIDGIKNNIYKIVYVAPERLSSESFINLLNSLEISMFTIDEAHCVSQWGHDFRPSYREIANIILNLKNRPIVSAFTATATQIVKEDIVELLHLENPFTLTTGFDRKNLSFSVEVPYKKDEFIFEYLQKNQDKSGIIYCATRKNVDALYDDLLDLGYHVTKYHGGLSEQIRTKNQEDFVYDRSNIMIATNAFGMGIDKSNIRYVIHYNMPKDLESYYQEAGRAGRDGDNSECILLFSRSDIITNKFLIEQTPSENNHKNEYDKLNDIIDYCNTDKCLRKYILEYFGEIPLFDNCHNCSNCLSTTELTDITIDSKKILSCIKRMNERFGSGLVTDVLKGSKSSKIKSMGFDNLSTYGIMADYSKDTIKDLIYFLITEGYIQCIGDKYPILKLDKSANDILFKNKTIFIKRKIEKTPNKTSTIQNYDETLFEILRNLRKEISEKINVPPFIIFSDASIKQMCIFYPQSDSEMLEIDGVGINKLENFGKDFISAISTYVQKNNVDTQKYEKFFTKKVKGKIKEKSSNKPDTKSISYEMYTNGHTIAEIAKLRELQARTIEQHLLQCFEEGMEINLEPEIQMEYKDKIFEAIHKIGYSKLRPLKDILPAGVQYFDISYFIIIYKKEIA